MKSKTPSTPVLVLLWLCCGWQLSPPPISSASWPRLPGAVLADPPAAAAGHPEDSSGGRLLSPRTGPGLSKGWVADQLRRALPLADQTLAHSSACRGLFHSHGADGRQLLARTLYSPATLDQESRICGRGVAAFTSVGGDHTRLCRTFGRLPTRRAAVVLIHEALHFAGLSESPADPAAPSSNEINRRVEESCGL